MATHTYIPLHEACLARVAAMLATQHGAGCILDLSSVIVVLPGRRAGRRLLELLCEHAHAHALVLVPPQTATVAAFCGRLVERAHAVLRATPLEQVCAWMEALAAAPAEVRAFFAPAAGEEQHAPDLFSVATTLTGLHAELAGERIGASILASLPFDDEKEGLRWRAFATLQEHYCQVLDAHQVLDPYDAVERALAANATSILPGVRAVYSVGIADFHQQYAAALAAVADRLTIVAHGDASWFEEDGRLTPDSPLDKLTSRLDEQQVHVADNAAAQAHTAVTVLAGLNGQYGPADITIGVPDVAVERALQQALRDAGVTAHSALGIPFRQTELGRLVACLTALLDTQAYATFLEFIRHPVGEAWLRTQAGCTDTDAWFAALLLQAESYAQDNIVDVITEDWRAPRGEYESVRLSIEHVKELLAAFTVERPLHEWPEVCNHALARLFSADVPGLQINQHDLAAIQAWCALMDAIRTARITCAGALPAVQALRWFMTLLRQEEITTDSEAIAVDLVGWLELALDDAPVIIVTGLNEGIVPGPGTSDPFLPNTARAQLGLQHDARRLRRDRYLLRALEQGARVLHVICGRRTGQNDPLLPSRLLFDVSEARAAALVQQFYGTPPDQPAAPATKAVAPAALVTAPRAAPSVMYAFAPPQPGPLSRPLTRVSVSALEDYLACPYRFYLARENVAEAPMAMGELNAAQVGTLLHDTLAAWGATQENVLATDPHLILAALLPLFHTRANAR
ncbi:MAG: PD-(D/E)XK nuclease family protein [bacterium]|nr:PD-(D/E)XK nuclease family protein [bacterium]